MSNGSNSFNATLIDNYTEAYLNWIKCKDKPDDQGWYDRYIMLREMLLEHLDKATRFDMLINALEPFVKDKNGPMVRIHDICWDKYTNPDIEPEILKGLPTEMLIPKYICEAHQDGEYMKRLTGYHPTSYSYDWGNS